MCSSNWPVSTISDFTQAHAYPPAGRLQRVPPHPGARPHAPRPHRDRGHRRRRMDADRAPLRPRPTAARPRRRRTAVCPAALDSPAAGIRRGVDDQPGICPSAPRPSARDIRPPAPRQWRGVSHRRRYRQGHDGLLSRPRLQAAVHRVYQSRRHTQPPH